MTSTPEWKQTMNRPRMKSLADVFPVPKPVIGMVHLWPLPGAPGYAGYGMRTIIEHALSDAEALLQGGVDGLIVENMWDLPYRVGTAVQPEAMTAQAVAAAEVVKNSKLPVGINVIHNGGVACLAIALAAGARFIRICILTGARVWTRENSTRGARRICCANEENYTRTKFTFSLTWTKSIPFLSRGSIFERTSSGRNFMARTH